jgi:hypothetical protein
MVGWSWRMVRCELLETRSAKLGELQPTPNQSCSPYVGDPSAVTGQQTSLVFGRALAPRRSVMHDSCGQRQESNSPLSTRVLDRDPIEEFSWRPRRNQRARRQEHQRRRTPSWRISTAENEQANRGRNPSRRYRERRMTTCNKGGRVGNRPRRRRNRLSDLGAARRVFEVTWAVSRSLPIRAARTPITSRELMGVRRFFSAAKEDV